MPNFSDSQATLKERKRKDRVRERQEAARRLIQTALSYKGDDEAAFVLGDTLAEIRHSKLLAAIYNELQYLDPDSAYGRRARAVVLQASALIARELVG